LSLCYLRKVQALQIRKLMDEKARYCLPLPARAAFTPLAEAERAVQGTLERIDFKRLAEKAVEAALARHQGRV
jgi:hypothetical protein